jgi:hypothetical protein
MTIAQQLHRSKTHKQAHDPACPVCQRHAQVAAALDDINARLLATVDGPNNSDIGFYATRGGVALVQWYENDQGFEIYVPVSRSAKTEDTLNALRAYGA